MSSEYRSRFGDPDPKPVTTPGVALEVIAEATSAGVAPGFGSRNRAATPATCGVADMPLIVFVAVSPVDHAELIETPGANRSTQARSEVDTSAEGLASGASFRPPPSGHGHHPQAGAVLRRIMGRGPPPGPTGRCLGPR